MIGGVRFVLAFVSALGCGLVAGVFFAFSSFVMPALARLPPAQGIAAMQAINETAVRPAFMSAFFGAAAGCLACIVWGFADRHAAYGPYLLIGGALYLVGTILTTIVCNVPLNNALAAVSSTADGAAGLWATYLTDWTWWNHVRTAAALAATAALIGALRAS